MLLRGRRELRLVEASLGATDREVPTICGEGRRRTSVKDLMLTRVGDVLRAPNGVLRIARKVSRPPTPRYPVPERGVHIFFTIRHCSWTRRCYTLYCVAELMERGYVNTGINVKIRTRKDRAITKCIERGGTEFRCCDVHGVV